MASKLRRKASSTRLSKEDLDELWGSTFLERHSYDRVRSLLKVLTKADAEDGEAYNPKNFTQIVQWVVHFKQGELSEDLQRKIAADKAAVTVFSGLFSLIDAAVRRKVETKVFESDLDKITFPEAYLSPLVKAFEKMRENLLNSSDSNRDKLPALDGLEWRVDVTISTSQLSRVFTPSLILQLTLSDGRIHTIECSRENFHLLRFNVAKILKNMQDLNHHPTLVQDI